MTTRRNELVALSLAPMKKPRIRPLALCIFRRGDRILVNEGHDPVKGETFFRPLGGGIEFTEQARDAAAREIREEIGAEVRNLRRIDTFENIFTYAGAPGHEIIFMFEAEFADPSFYERERIDVDLAGGEPVRASWKTLAFFEEGRAPLYPDGLLELLKRTHG